MNQTFRQALQGISLAVLAAVLAAWLFCTIPATGWKALVVPTGSMRPGMPPGSLALVHRVPAGSLHVGDVITYASPLNAKETITHRIVRTFSIGGKVPGFITKGDANAVADPTIAAGNVQGEVVWHVPYVGTGLLWAKTWVGLTLLVYLPALVIIVQEFRRLRSYYARLAPYRLAAYKYRWAIRARPRMRWKMSSAAAAVFVAATAAAWSPAVLAQLRAGPVTLANDQLLLAPRAGSCSNTNTTQATGITTQSAESGGAPGPNATTGSATNTSSTNIDVTGTTSC